MTRKHIGLEAECGAALTAIGLDDYVGIDIFDKVLRAMMRIGKRRSGEVAILQKQGRRRNRIIRSLLQQRRSLVAQRDDARRAAEGRAA